MEKQIVKTTTTGDKASMKNIQRELNSTKRMIGRFKGSPFLGEKDMGLKGGEDEGVGFVDGGGVEAGEVDTGVK